ncbi:capsular biosynthesis protein [filamentous cyanobacterium CCP5]|nr:capsular biosynthesis protein [filamentous cyanobacterium CCP5]
MTHAAYQPIPDEPEFGYGQLLGILLRRWPWIAGTLVLSVAGAVLVFLREDPTYRSSMQLIVEPNYEDDVTARELDGLANASDQSIDYNTQLTLMRSEQFLREAVASLEAEYPDLDVDQVVNTFSLQRVGGEERDKATRVFQATYVDSDPIKTQRLLEALKEAYLEFNEAQQARRLERGLEHTNNRLDNTQKNLQQAQAALEKFRQSQNLIDPTLQSQAVVTSLNEVQSEQRQLMSQLTELKSRYQTLEQRTQLSPANALLAARLSQSQRVQQLLNDIQESELALADRQLIFTDQDATVQMLRQELDNNRKQLRQEIAAAIRRPVETLNPDIASLLQLGGVDLSLVTDLLEADVAIAGISARWESLATQEQSLRQELNRYPSWIAEYDRLQPRVEIERATLQDLLLQREQISAELARGGFDWQIVEPPDVGDQIGPDPLRPIALGVVAGLFVGGGLAFARDSMDKVVRTSDDLKRQVPLPLLGILPVQPIRKGFSLPGRQDGGPPILHPELADSDLMQIVQWPTFREALDLVANNVQLMLKGKGNQAIAVTSSLPSEGKTTVALGLAFSLARMRQRVLVIDADLRRSGIATELGLSTEGNLANLLKGVTRPSRPHRLDFGPGHIDVLPAGDPLNDPITLLSSPRFQKLIHRCKSIYDVVLVDTPPLTGMADALKIGAVCDNVLLVARLDKITQPQIDVTMALLSQLQVLGIVANGARTVAASYSDYGHLSKPVRQTA